MATLDVRLPDGSTSAFPARPPREDELYFVFLGVAEVPDAAGWDFTVDGLGRWAASHGIGWYTHPAMPDVLLRRVVHGWWLYHSPHSRQTYIGDKSRLERVDPRLMPAWRSVVTT